MTTGDTLVAKKTTYNELEEKIKQLEQRKLEAMLGFCEIVACRRANLLSYFGEQSAVDCGN